MRLKDTGLTSQDIKDKVNKYMIETYERFDFLAERAKDMYMYDENGEEYLDFYAGIAVNNAGSCNEKVVAAVKDRSHGSGYRCNPAAPDSPAAVSAWRTGSASFPSPRQRRSLRCAFGTVPGAVQTGRAAR